MKQYVYIFTRQDISPEQQAVQSAHATYKLGTVIGGIAPSNFPSPNETYFTLIGVRNLEALMAVEMILVQFGYRYVVFNEPDLNGGEDTSIAIYPIPENERGPLMVFDLLKMSRV